MLLLPAVAIFLLVSSQTGFSRYLRYVLPSFPFLFIFISKVAQSIKFRQWIISIPMAAALLWSVGSSFLAYPHSMSYFNEIAGGPKGGHWYLIDANIDWGQDMLYLKKWCDAHPEARPLYISCHGLVEPVHLGIKASQPPPGPGKKILASQDPIFDAQNCGPQPGWYAISIHMLHERDGSNDYFLKYFKPVATVGYSIYLYHITLEDANRVRGDLGLPLLESEE